MNNKIKEFFTPKKILIILVLLCGLLIGSSFFTDKLVMPLRSAVSQVVVPLQKGMNALGIGIVDHHEKKKNIADLQARNSELSGKLAELQEENKILKQNAEDLVALQKLYKMDQSLSSYTKVGASVIGGATQSWNSSLMIDKGSKDGLQVDMNVIGSDGLVGIITEVHPNYSIVTTIIADTSNVSAMSESTGDQATVRGDISLMDSGMIRIERMKASANIKDGDKIVTSNISSKYLPNILIGYAKNITSNESDLFKTGYITPAVDFDHIQKVLVITQKKQDLIKE